MKATHTPEDTCRTLQRVQDRAAQSAVTVDMLAARGYAGSELLIQAYDRLCEAARLIQQARDAVDPQEK